jgi:RNA-binding protein
MKTETKITTKQKCELRSKAHSLKPVVTIGSSGLTISVHKEIDRTLEDHELIKIRVNAEDRDYKKQIIAEICAYNFAELIQIVGNIATIYRKKFALSPRFKNISLLVRKIINIVSQNEGVEKAYIFGSRTKGDAKDVSDIDLAIAGEKISAKEWSEICDKIEDLDTLLAFDIIRLDTSDVGLQDEVKKHGVIIYERH